MDRLKKLRTYFIPVFRMISKTTFKVPKRERRFIVGGALVVFLIFVYQVVFSPILSKGKDREEEILIKENMLAKYKGVSKKKGQLQKDISLLKLRLKEIEGGLLDGSNPSLAAAALQEIINETASQSGISISSVRVLPSSSIEMYTEIPVRIQTTCSILGLKDFLYKIENHTKLLSIKETNIYTPHSSRRTQSQKASGGMENFRTDLVIAGFIRS